MDFLAYDRNGRLVAAVEAKRRLGANARWATNLRAVLLDRGGELGSVPFFVIVVPEAIYIWTAVASPDAPPRFEIDARVVLTPYYERVEVEAERIHPMAFETLVWWWLRDLTLGRDLSHDPSLAASGLIDALNGGQLAQQVAA